MSCLLEIYSEALKMKSLPSFQLESFRVLIKNFILSGFRLKPASALPDRETNSVYLRHDVDFSIELSVPMAEVEAELRVQSIYYILLTGPYNVLNKNSVNAIKKIVELGHQIGLHYDLQSYPTDELKATQKLQQESEIIKEITGHPLLSIVMHEPFKGGADIFINKKEYLNPSFFQKNDTTLCYISDSCRAWRDDNLLRFLSRQTEQDRLLLNIHPESWLSKKPMHRLSYLEQILTPMALSSTKKYFLSYVRSIWMTHSAAVSGFGDIDE